jgi:hypothetical protein
MIIQRPMHCDVLVSSSDSAQAWREFLAGAVGIEDDRGPSLRRAIPRCFVQDDKVGRRRRLSNRPRGGGWVSQRPRTGLSAPHVLRAQSWRELLTVVVMASGSTGVPSTPLRAGSSCVARFRAALFRMTMRRRRAHFLSSFTATAWGLRCPRRDG